MGSADRTCKLCGTVVSGADIDAGRAVILLRRPYCLRCSDRLADPRGRRDLWIGVGIAVAVVSVAVGVALLAFRALSGG